MYVYVCAQFTLLFQNRTEDDILLKDELEKLEKSYGDRLAVYYYLSNPGTEEFGEYSHTGVSLSERLCLLEIMMLY